MIKRREWLERIGGTNLSLVLSVRGEVGVSPARAEFEVGMLGVGFGG